jgi:hypothetical protein
LAARTSSRHHDLFESVSPEMDQADFEREDVQCF